MPLICRKCPLSNSILVFRQNEEAKLLPSTVAGPSNSNSTEPSEPVKKKRRGPKGPNPLSVKKKVVKEGRREPKNESKGKGKEETTVEIGKKRKRDDGGDDDHGDNGHDNVQPTEKRVTETHVEHVDGLTASTVVTKKARKRNRKRNKESERG